MEEKLSQVQLQQVIAEVQRLADYNSELVGMEEVRQILQELNLPPDSLEEALVQVQRRQALEHENQQKRKMIGSAIAVLSIAIAIPSWFIWQHQQTIARVAVQSEQITTASGQPMPIVVRQKEVYPQVVYTVQLKEAPVGKKLTLNCDWIDPKNQVVHQNHYETRDITTQIWTTRCQYSAGPNTTPGKWTVRLFLEGRVLSEGTFEVK
jgi:hypothetical protein